MERCTAACQHQNLRKAWGKVTSFRTVQCHTWWTASSWQLRVCTHEHVQVCLTTYKHAMYLSRYPRVQSSCAQARSLEGDQDKCGDALVQLHAARQSKPHLVPACLCTHTLNNCGCFPEQVSRLHYIFTCLARDRTSALINEEKGLLALQEIYVTVSLSQPKKSCVLFLTVVIPRQL